MLPGYCNEEAKHFKPYSSFHVFSHSMAKYKKQRNARFIFVTVPSDQKELITVSQFFPRIPAS